MVLSLYSQDCLTCCMVRIFLLTPLILNGWFTVGLLLIPKDLVPIPDLRSKFSARFLIFHQVYVISFLLHQALWTILLFQNHPHKMVVTSNTSPPPSYLGHQIVICATFDSPTHDRSDFQPVHEVTPR